MPATPSHAGEALELVASTTAQPPEPVSVGVTADGRHLLELVSHVLPARQSSDVAHVVPHAPVDVQRYGWQLCGTPASPLTGIDCVPSGEQVAVTCGTHLPPVQVYELAQSASAVQLVLHAVAPHAYAPQLEVVGCVHLPAPSQVAEDVAVPFVHEGATHSLSRPLANAAHFVRSLVPSQASTLQTSPPPSAQAARLPCGAPLTPEHFPSTPLTSHASHCPVHAPSQHTPSTQYPEAQSPLAAQVWPSCFTQLPAAGPAAVSPHALPATQLATPQQTLAPGAPEATQWPLVH
jgi:hypothetical protein